jgi:hypothetical protein
MARPRKSDSVINGIVEQFAKHLAGALSGFISANTAVKGKAGRGAGHRGVPRARVLCYFPGCKNLAAPRFGMFCASEHKDLSKADKDKYRALHLGNKSTAKAGRVKKK